MRCLGNKEIWRWSAKRQPKYSGESQSSRGILMRDKWSYCAWLKGLVKPEGRDSYCGGEHLTGLLGGAEKCLCLSFTVLWSQFLKTAVCLCLLCFFPPLLSPPHGVSFLYHLILPALTELHCSLPPCHPLWFNVLYNSNHRINHC